MRVRISRMAATTEKPSTPSAIASAARSCRPRFMKVRISRSDKPGSVAHAGDMARRLAALAPAMPPRTSEVHDSKVRRITAITPDMFAPKPHDDTTGKSIAVRESANNILKRSRRVRVQTVNGNPAMEKCAAATFQKRFL